MAKPYSMENNTSHRKLRLQCPEPSVIKPEASACDHSILTPRHQSAPLQYEPIINPQDVPTLQSFPSSPDTDQSEATLVRIHMCYLWISMSCCNESTSRKRLETLQERLKCDPLLRGDEGGTATAKD